MKASSGGVATDDQEAPHSIFGTFHPLGRPNLAHAPPAPLCPLADV